MAQGNGYPESAPVLLVEVIDDQGRVVDQVYVPEITKTSCPIVQRRRTTDGGRRSSSH